MIKKQYVVPEAVWEYIRIYVSRRIHARLMGITCPQCDDEIDLVWKNLSELFGFKPGTQEAIPGKEREHLFLAEPNEMTKEEAFTNEPRKRCSDTLGNSDLA